MGQEFAIIFDAVIVVVVAGFFFAGWKNGFAKVILSMIASIAAFACAMIFSKPIAETFYRNVVAKPLTEQLDTAVSEGLRSLRLGGITGIDYDKAAISGVPVTEAVIDYAGTDKAMFELLHVDLSETGMDVEDLKAIGLREDLDLTDLNGKNADFSRDDIERYGLGKLVTAQVIAVQLTQREDFADFNEIAAAVGKYIPAISGTMTSDTLGVNAARTLALKMLETNDTIRDTVMDGIIEPNCIILIRTIVFILIFSVVAIVLNLVANLTKVINKVPVIGKANALAGGLAGVCEGIVAVLVVCVVTRFIVTLSGGGTILFNRTTIDSTIVFKYIYDVDVLNFLT